MSYPREIKEYYRDAFQQAKNRGGTLPSFPAFVLQEKGRILSVIKEFTVENSEENEIDWLGVAKRLREEGKITKFIPLTTLQKIVQFSGKEGFELENVFEFPTNTVTQNEELQQTAVPRIDDLVQSQSDSEFTFAVEWISNAIDAVSPHKQIGRFGEGFFQSLQHLQDEGNEIQVESKSGDSDAYKVSLQKRGNDLYVAPEQHLKDDTGTCVSLKKDLGDIKKRKLQEYISAKFGANTRAIITLNGEQINNFGKYNYINGQDAIDQDSLPHVSIELDSGGIKVSDSGVGMDSHDLAGKLLYPNTTSKKREKVTDDDVKKLSPDETRFFYTHKQDKKDKTHISLQVAGVIIEDFHIASVGNIGECIFEFPSFSPLEDSRNEIKVGRETTISLTSALEKIAHKTKNTQDKLGLLEVIGSIYHHLKDRPTNIVDEDFTLETNMKRTFKGIKEDIEKTGVTILPAEEKIMNCFGTRDDIFYIDPDFIDFQVENIPGISEISESVLGRSTTKQGKKIRFFEVDFDTKATHDYVLGEEYVLINRTLLAEKTDEQRDILIQVINIGVNLNTSYEMVSERVSYGRLPTSSEGKIVAEAPKEKRAVISLESIQNRTKQASGSSSEENIEEYDYASEIAYIDQELEVFEEKYIAKFPKSISNGWGDLLKKKQRPQFQDQQEKEIRGLLRAGRSIENVVKRMKISMMLKISRLGIETQQTDTIYTLLCNFLESKNSSLTSPTLEFLSSLAESMIFSDTPGFIRYTLTLLKALDQDPKNVITLIQEFTQKREIWENDPYVGHLERTRVTKTDLSAFGVFRDMVQEKQKSITKPEKKNGVTPRTIEYSEEYELDITQLNIIAENLFLSSTRRQIWAFEILEELPKLSPKKLTTLRSYLLTTDTTVLELKKIQEILGGELGKIETNISIFESLQSIFHEENRIKENQIWADYRDGSWLDIDYFNKNMANDSIIAIFQHLESTLREGKVSHGKVLKLRQLVFFYFGTNISDTEIKIKIEKDIREIVPEEYSIEGLHEYFSGEMTEDLDSDASYDVLLSEYGYMRVHGMIIPKDSNENTEEGNEYSFPNGWFNTMTTICQDYDRQRMYDIVNMLDKHRTPKEVYLFRKDILECCSPYYIESFLQLLGDDAGVDLISGIAINDFLLYFDIFFTNEDHTGYHIDLQYLDGLIAEVFPDSTKQPPRDIILLDSLIKNLGFIPKMRVDRFRRLLLNQDNFSMQDIMDIFPHDFFTTLYNPNTEEENLRVTNMLKQLFAYEVQQQKDESENEREIQDVGTYQFPDNISNIIQIIIPKKDSHKRGYTEHVIEVLKKCESTEIYSIRHDILEGVMDKNSFLLIIRKLDGNWLDDSIYEEVFYYLKQIFEYETVQKENDTYYEYSFLNHKNQVSELTAPQKKLLAGFMQTTLIKGETNFMTEYSRLRKAVYLLSYIKHHDDSEIVRELGIMSSEIFDIEDELKKELHLFLHDNNISIGSSVSQYDDIIGYFKLEYSVSNEGWYGMLLDQDYGDLLVELGFTRPSKGEQEIENTQSAGVYQFPDDIMDIVSLVVDSNDSLYKKIKDIIDAMQESIDTSRIYDVRELFLRGTMSIKYYESLIEELNRKSNVDYISEEISNYNYDRLFNHLKEIFEYEIIQKGWNEYDEYSYINPATGLPGYLENTNSELIYDALIDLLAMVGIVEFKKKFHDIRQKAYLLAFIGKSELGFTDSEKDDIKSKLVLSINGFLSKSGTGYAHLLEYFQGEFGNFHEWQAMVDNYDHSSTLRKLGYTPVPLKKESSKGKKEEVRNISDIKLPEEFFMSLSGKYSPDIIAFAQFLESNGEYLSPRESKVEISESGVISTALSQIISTSLKNSSALGEGINLSEFTGLISEPGAEQKNYQDLIAGVCLGQDEVSMYFLREGIQNARDALISAGKSDSPILVDAYERDGKFATSVSDGVGMELSDVITKLLTPYNSGKNGTGATGKFGKGFFTFAVGCSELRIKSSSGNGVVSYMKMMPQLQDGIITDFEVFIEEKQEEFTGTTIERVDELGGIHGNLRALIGTHLLKKYVGNTEDVDINFAGTVINKATGKTLIEESPSLQDKDGKDIGTIKIHKTKDNTERFTKDNLWISEIKEDILSDFPDWIIDFVRAQKYSIDIPAGTPLVGSRNSIENREYYVNLFKPHIYKMVVQIVLNEHVGGSLRIPMMPEDYLALLQYEYKTNDGITTITRSYNSGGTLTSGNIESLKDKAHMAQFLTEVEFSYRGKQTSLRAIKKQLHENKLAAENYGPRYRSKISQAVEQKDSLNQRPEKHNLSYREITELTGLSKYKIQKFKNFISESLDPVITERFGGEYNISFHRNSKGGEIASSYGNGGAGCSFRVDTPEFKRLIENISSPKTQERLMNIVAHEMTHNVEDTLGTRKWGTHETDELHDASFMRINREIITQLGRGLAIN